MVDIGVLVNSSTYMIHGSSLETTAAYITSIYLLTEGDYTGAFNDDLKFKINEMIISTSESTDPWPWTFDIELGITMDLFSSWAVTGFHAPNDLTSYWFNDGLSGGNIGWGQLGQTCHINGDAVLREEGSAQTMRCLLSHEHGHNFNALHDAEGSAYIMAPIIKAGHLKFSSTSKAAINNHLASSAADCISACTFTECERMGPRNLSIRYDSAQAGILCTWENESAGMGHIIQWWVLGDTILNSDTAAAIDTSFFIRISDNPACRVYKVQVAKFCSPGVAGWFMAPISITVGNKITPQPFITAINNVLYSSADTGNQWFLDGAAIPGATGISHVTRSSGSYSVQATVQGCSSPMSDPYYHIFRSVNYSPLEAQFIIAPNPVRDKLLIRNAGPSPSYMLTVYDIIGRKVFASSVFSASYTLNMKTFRAGIYIILIDIHQSGERIKRRVLKE